MEFIRIEKEGDIARVVIARGKVNALNEKVVDELAGELRALAGDPGVRALVLTGQGKFFTFGFDIPEFLDYRREDFLRYLTKFTDLYTYVFLYPKPVVAALNGHTIAGGCMLSIACDYRIMVPGKARISLNEIEFGSSLFAGSVEMMKFWVGNREAERLILGGAMYSAEEALRIGLIDEIVPEDQLAAAAKRVAGRYGSKDAAAFESIKKLSRQDVASVMRAREKESLLEFVNIWYSEGTWRRLQEKKIHG
jgi:enoyl-CoA hydratase/carnithine racemase